MTIRRTALELPAGRSNKLLTLGRKEAAGVLQFVPILKQTYALRQQLTAIIDQEPPKAVGQQKIRNWIKRVRQGAIAMDSPTRCARPGIQGIRRYKPHSTFYISWLIQRL